MKAKRLRGGQSTGTIPSTNPFSIYNIFIILWGCLQLYSLGRYFYCLGYTAGFVITAALLVLYSLIYVSLSGIVQAYQSLTNNPSILSLIFIHGASGSYRLVIFLGIALFAVVTVGMVLPCYPPF
jgi:hypothetical protein